MVVDNTSVIGCDSASGSLETEYKAREGEEEELKLARSMRFCLFKRALVGIEKKRRSIRRMKLFVVSVIHTNRVHELGNASLSEIAMGVVHF